MNDWVKGAPLSVTVCDADGVILEMNDRARKTFEKSGGGELVGKNLLDCHPEPAGTKVREMLAKRYINAYTIEKNGVKKLIYQAPWQKDGKFAGIVELSLEIPLDMPHFVRK
ncbi:MAG: diguanylate cyclase [Elusimicrobia bacterium RIFOXYB2_FULL_62_6]|nr:MAG: diguanylate cyclase [Elusimicrobia bacterium RIFOXYB2_FULL_62_6]